MRAAPAVSWWDLVQVVDGQAARAAAIADGVPGDKAQ
jgi:hypothetical protein